MKALIAKPLLPEVEDTLAEDALLDHLREVMELGWGEWREEELDLLERYNASRLGVGGAAWPGRS